MSPTSVARLAGTIVLFPAAIVLGVNALVAVLTALGRCDPEGPPER